jgi:RNA polymerase sigma-70 factor (ECF subfamily)
METNVKVRFQANKIALVTLSQSAAVKLKHENLPAGDISPEEGGKASEQLQDLELVRRSQAGDTEAFGQLITKYRAKIFAMVYGMVSNEHDARDLAQEAFLKAWQSIGRFQRRSSFYTWLYRIAINVTICSLRRKSSLEERELNDDIPSSLPGPGVNCQRLEIRERVDSALAKLSPEHRAVVVLKELEGLQYHEIAEVLNLSIGTVMSRLFYARKHLQSLLRPTYSQM